VAVRSSTPANARRDASNATGGGAISARARFLADLQVHPAWIMWVRAECTYQRNDESPKKSGRSVRSAAKRNPPWRGGFGFVEIERIVGAKPRPGDQRRKSIAGSGTSSCGAAALGAFIHAD
jgi:hypothetical protein